MNDETFHFYRCTQPDKLPSYQFIDYSNGLVGYPNKLAQAVSNYAGAYYLGFMTEKEVLNLPKGGRRPAKLNKKKTSNY